MGVTAVVVSGQFAVEVGTCSRGPFLVSRIHHRLMEHFAVGFEPAAPVVTGRQRRPEVLRAGVQGMCSGNEFWE